MGLYVPLERRALTLTSWQLYRFSIPFRSSGYREGLILHVSTKEKGSYYTEISPLVGRSQETLEQAYVELLRFLREETLSVKLPSVCFGIESLMLPCSYPLTASLYPLLTGSCEEILILAKKAQKKGHSQVKCKVGHLSIPEAQKILSLLLNTFSVRVDCNSQFSFSQALDLFAPFSADHFDYIEDPTYELDKLPQFPYPFAIDEQICRYRDFHVQTHPTLKGFVIKPSLTSDIPSILEYAKKQNLSCTFSSALETGVGLVNIMRLAHAYGHTEPLGLDTQRFFHYDLLEQELHFDGPSITVLKPPQLKLEHLTPLDHGTNRLPLI